MTANGVKDPERARLIEGVKMRCPRCERLDSILAYMVLEEIEKYASETAPIYKCPPKRGGCGWLFSLAETAVNRVL